GHHIEMETGTDRFGFGRLGSIDTLAAKSMDPWQLSPIDTLLLGFQSIANATYCPNDRICLINFDFLPQSQYGLAHGIDRSLAVCIPYSVEQIVSRKNATGVAHEQFKKCKLFGV